MNFVLILLLCYVRNITNTDSDNNLCDNSGVRRNLQVGAAGEGLSTGLHVGQVLVGAQALVLLKVGEELQQITREVGDGGLGNEAVDGHLAVGAGVKLPVDTVDVGGGDGRAGGGDGTSTAEGSKPDHDLVLLVAIGGGAGEEVVGDISNDVVVGVAGQSQIWISISSRSSFDTNLQLKLDLMLFTALSLRAEKFRATLA